MQKNVCARLEQLQDQAYSCSRDVRAVHGSKIEGKPGTLQTSLHYGIEGFSRCPNWVPLCREAQATRAEELNFLQSGKSLEKIQSFSSLVSFHQHTTRAGKKTRNSFSSVEFLPSQQPPPLHVWA